MGNFNIYLIVFVTLLMSNSLAASPASSTLSWQGTVPGGFSGSNIGLSSQNGKKAFTSGLTILESGRLYSQSSLSISAYSLKVQPNKERVVDTNSLYPGNIGWFYTQKTITHIGRRGSAYKNQHLQVHLNGTTKESGEIVYTRFTSPNLEVDVTYEDTPERRVYMNDSIEIKVLLFVEGAFGQLVEGASNLYTQTLK